MCEYTHVCVFVCVLVKIFFEYETILNQLPCSYTSVMDNLVQLLFHKWCIQYIFADKMLYAMPNIVISEYKTFAFLSVL